MAAPRVTDPREAERRERVVRELDLRRTDPELVMLETTMAGRPESPLMHRLAVARDERIQSHLDRQETNPFPTAPASSINQGEFVIAYQKTDGTPIMASREELAQPTLIAGRTGAGKTTLATNLIGQVIAFVHLFILDLKDDLRALASTHPSMVVLHHGAPLSLLSIPTYAERHEYANLFISAFTDSFFSAQLGRQVLTPALTTLLQDAAHPSIQDLRERLGAQEHKGDTYQWRDAVRGMTLRLQQLENAFPGLATARNGITMGDLLDTSVYVPTDRLDQAPEFLFYFLLLNLFIAKRRQHQRDPLTHLVVMDEGLSSWGQRSEHRITGTPLLATLLGMTREFGIGFLVTTNSLSTTDVTLKSNAGIQLITSLASHQDETEVTRTFGLNPAQAQYLNRSLTRGEVLIRLGDRWRHPILAVYPRGEYDKTVNPDDWERAKARTNALAPTIAPNSHSLPVTDAEPTRTIVTMTAPAPPPLQDTPSPEQNPLPTTTATNATPNLPSAGTSAAPRVMALNTSEAALLTVVCDAVTPSTPAYQKAGLGLANGDNAAKRLEQKALIERERIVIRSGRGGTAMGLRATTTGYTRAGKRRNGKTRGGDSIQHEYPVQELHRFLAGSTVEAMVGTKPVDLLLPVNTERDKKLLDVLRPLLPPNGALSDGDLVALEVEVSDPPRTAPRNAASNYEAGIAFTVIAVLPKQLVTTARALAVLAPNVQDHTLLVNVLQLLSHLGG